jgi:antitoxin component of RelBE/YafQ-DinJ toxin-antitoxin module
VRSEYDFSKSRKNPYAKRLKRQITIRLDATAVDYFKKLAAEMGIPYQNLINLYLRDCADRKARPALEWTQPTSPIPKPRSRSASHQSHLANLCEPSRFCANPLGLPDPTKIPPAIKQNLVKL